MTRLRLPFLPTLFVALAAATMVALGIWQLGRAEEKAALIERSRAALAMSSEVEYPADEAALERVLYRRTTVECVGIRARGSAAGTSAKGAKGWAHRVTCDLARGGVARIDIGFSRDPAPPQWDGGEVRGIIAPGNRIVAASGLAGLEPLAPPDPEALPNNHLAYAGQWFFFALTALAIYWLALRRRVRGREKGEA